MNKIKYYLEQINTTVSLQILFMPEHLRSNGVVFDNKFMRLCSHSYPELTDSLVLLPGTDRLCDKNFARKQFNTEADAINYYCNVKDLLDQYNKSQSGWAVGYIGVTR